MKVREFVAELMSKADPELEIVVARRGYYAGGIFYAPVDFTISVQPTAYTGVSKKDIAVIGFTIMPSDKKEDQNAILETGGLLPNNGDEDPRNG